MPSVLILSSYVAASRVGGGIAPYVLGPLGIEAIHLPTTLFGRHPGWGAPGGETVSADTLQSMLDGIADHGCLETVDAVLFGYFASAAQVERARDLCDRLKTLPVESVTGRRLIVVDPILGDADTGLYVRPEVEAAMKTLVPYADLLTPNVWELGRLTGQPVETHADIKNAMEQFTNAGMACLTTSIAGNDRIGAVHKDADSSCFASTPLLSGPLPKGSGDLLTLLMLAHLLNGSPVRPALSDALGGTFQLLQRARASGARELPIIRLFRDVGTKDASQTTVVEFSEW